MPRILFVCTGNICRSPAAMALLQQRVEREGLTDWIVESAGTWTVSGRAASRHIVRLMAARGIDLTGHSSRGVDRQMLKEADLVLVMTRGHAEALRLEFPDQAARIFLLSQMKGGRRYDVEDPYGGTFEQYAESVAVIEDLIDAGFDQIRRLVDQGID
jgi:protein-tyrosine phosphatase